MKIKNNYESIIRNLSVLSYIIRYNSENGYTDINKHAENFYMEILNKVYDWELENLNSSKKNHPGADLGDKKNKIAVQITSTSSKSKIEDTLNKIKNHGLDKIYDTLYILILTEKKKHKISKTSKIKFDVKNNLLSVNDILSKIEFLGFQKIQELSDFISQQIDFVTSESAIKGSIFDVSSSFNGTKYQNLNKVYNYYERQRHPENDIKDHLQPFIDELYLKLDKISQDFRKAFLFFIIKSSNGELSLQNWGSMIEKDLSMSRATIYSIVDEFENNNLAYDDEGQPSRLCIPQKQKDGWLTIIDMYDNKYLTRENLENLIVNRDFSVLDA